MAHQWRQAQRWRQAHQWRIDDRRAPSWLPRILQLQAPAEMPEMTALLLLSFHPLLLRLLVPHLCGGRVGARAMMMSLPSWAAFPCTAGRIADERGLGEGGGGGRKKCDEGGREGTR